MKMAAAGAFPLLVLGVAFLIHFAVRTRTAPPALARGVFAVTVVATLALTMTRGQKAREIPPLPEGATGAPNVLGGDLGLQDRVVDARSHAAVVPGGRQYLVRAGQRDRCIPASAVAHTLGGRHGRAGELGHHLGDHGIQGRGHGDIIQSRSRGTNLTCSDALGSAECRLAVGRASC